jgi:Rps23 Pro-64 3,4-dihydroxylase Tpa1-like proline 4-hydroxylase
MVQRYIKNEGRYVYHDDSNINFDKKEYRVITYLWYLNTVEEG